MSILKEKEHKTVKISTKGRYAMRIMLDLAIHNTGEYVTVKDISNRQGVTVKYLERIIAALSKAGYVIGLRGNGGGYKLSMEPREYTIGNILRATEGSLAPISCVDGMTTCEKSCNCPTFSFWQGLNRVINEYIDSVSLQDLLDNENALKRTDNK